MGNGTPLGRVRGLGSAREGTHHWIVQRITAIGNLLAGGFLIASLLLLPDLSHATLREWIAGPMSATAMALLVVTTFWHAKLGLQVLIEDYVHAPGNKVAVLLALNIAAVAGIAFGLFAIGKMALGGAA
ncbi:succinate dehydrogenase, hydrophobic membrane anchor protein [Altererythrobacter salegens]|uniref:Succinate dehydrogenase hydrophobic membrane anchor subunit n=1 Tax=Croceibacterium salegens TaxID=1737568 RepID=A0A6I4SSZ5_9SPHN|nr:succinate dehydrogenase, hydrophobic membrane anchor protein [Croceibacterium salegens]MXO58659.1 succinate dehydrogenase, hydrophobic membrane anchor protein [Croceibacterium salegens]